MCGDIAFNRVKAEVDVDEVERRIREKIVILRRQKGFTQESFDMEPNAIPVRTIQRYEQAKNPNIELKTLLKIADKLGVKPSELIDVDLD